MLRHAALLAVFSGLISAQILTGRLEGTILFPDGRPRVGEAVTITGGAGFEITVRTDDQGRFAVVLPYGVYRISGVPVRVDPMATTHADLVLDPSAPPQTVPRHANLARRQPNPLPFSLQGELLSLDPATVSEPLNFTGLADNRLGLLSIQGFSWTATQFRLEGMDASDSYQPGRPLALPDVQAIETTLVRSGFALTTSASYGAEAGALLAQPGAEWHGAVEADGTGAPLASGNLPAAGARGDVLRSERYEWMTRDHVEIGGPIAHRADLFASGTGQWSSQTMQLVPAGTNQGSRMLYGNIRARVRPSDRNSLDALLSGSRVDLSNGGVPAGIEALVARRVSPEFVVPGGFPNEAEEDHFDFVQAGWTHQFGGDLTGGAVELRYGYAVAHLDTRGAGSNVPDQSRIEIEGSAVAGAPPLANMAVRTRHELAAAWQSGALRTGPVAHRITAGGGWRAAAPRNRFMMAGDMNLITAAGVPAFVVGFSSARDSQERVNSGTVYAADHISIAAGLSADIGVLGDLARGGLPAQSAPAGAFFPARQFTARPDLIVWNSVSPRAGFAWHIPHARGLTVQGGWFRLFTPLAGRYLDSGNANSLGGNEYQWMDRNGDGWFEPGEQGPLLMRFGGPFSSIDPDLRRPYGDEIHAGVQMPLSHVAIAGLRFFRRDEKSRIAAIDTGVPEQDYTPVAGPDGLTVWAQNPASLGQDRYVLSNPAGLRELNEGLVAEVGSAWRGVTLRTSFMAEKSYGPTNPGNAVFENDPGVVGALFLDPNTAINASNRAFMDRAYVGKLQGVYRLPPVLGSLQLASIVTYVDGLVFSPQLLVTGLPQGPFLVNETVRGSPEGGNRTQYAANWNLRVSRDFRVRTGNLLAAADFMNVTNAGNSVQQSDIAGPNFRLRLPVEIQPARYARLEIRFDF